MPDVFEDGTRALIATHEVATSATMAAMQIYMDLWSLGHAVTEQQFLTMVFGLGFELPPTRVNTKVGGL